jgi:hypothetical protein
MKLNQRLERLEQQFISEPTLLFMPDGKTVSLTSPNDYVLTLLGLTMHPERATATQTAHLNLIEKCVGSKEPGGARLVELIQCFQHGPAKESTEVAG